MSSSSSSNDSLLNLTINKLFNEFLLFSSKYLSSSSLSFLKSFKISLISSLPLLSSLFQQFLEIIFSPQLFLKQLLIIFTLQSLVFSFLKLNSIFSLLFYYLTEKGRKILSLNLKMKEALSYNEWKRLGEIYDNLKGDLYYSSSSLSFFSIINLSYF